MAGIVVAASIDARVTGTERRVFAAEPEVARMERGDAAVEALPDDAPRDVGHARTPWTVSAASSTSSRTAPIAFSRSLLSITGTFSTWARSTM